MKKIKYILVILAFSLISVLPVLSQNAANTSTSASGTTITESTTVTKSQNTMSYLIGGLGIVALGIVIGMMHKNRMNTLGGIQNQHKPSPTPATTQSMDHPGSGI